MGEVTTVSSRPTAVVSRYGFALATVAVALGVALLARWLTVQKVEFPLLLMAVAITVWSAGMLPGLLAVVLAGVGFDYFFIEPLHTFYIAPTEWPLFIAFLVFALVIAFFSERRRRIEHQLRDIRGVLEREVAERTQQASLLDLTHDTIFVRDMKDVITYWNRGAEELFGYRAEQAVGQRAHQLLKTVFPMPPGEIQAELHRTGRWEGELDRTRADGTPVAVASRWSLRRDASDQPVAILETNNDITDRRRREEQIRNLNHDLARRTDELQQVLLNLMMNAIEAMSGSGPTARELVDGAGQHHPKLRLESRVVDAHRPVGDGRDVAAVLTEHGKQLVQRDIGAAAATLSATLIGRVGDDPIEPRAERGVSTKRIDLPDHGQEGVLHGFLGILRVPRDPCGEAVSAAAVGGHKILGSRRITPAEGRHERAIAFDPCRHARAAPIQTSADGAEQGAGHA